MLYIYLEPLKLLTKSENAVTERQYQNTIAPRLNQCLVNHNLLTLSCFHGFNWQLGGSGEEFFSGEGLQAYEMCRRDADAGQYLFVS